MILALLIAITATLFWGLSDSVAQGNGPTMLHTNLAVRTVVSGLITPTAMAFIGPNEFFVLEKNTGKVQRVANGVIQSTVLDLAVKFGSERGLREYSLPTVTCFISISPATGKRSASTIRGWRIAQRITTTTKAKIYEISSRRQVARSFSDLRRSILQKDMEIGSLKNLG